MDVVAKLKSGASGGRYDTLPVTETHALLDALKWGKSLRNLRHFHHRCIAGSPSGNTWFCESWLDVGNKADPRRGIDCGRDASRVWGCIAMRVSALLADLVERATQGPRRVGPHPGPVPEHRRQPDPGPCPPNPSRQLLHGHGDRRHGVRSQTLDHGHQRVWTWNSHQLQTVAAKIVQAQSKVDTISRDDGEEFIRSDSVTRYWTSVREARENERGGAIRASDYCARNLAKWHFNIRFRPGAEQLRFDTATTASYWLPPPAWQLFRTSA